jgi:chorismate mutase
VKEGAAKLAALCRAAVKRHGPKIVDATELFTDAERQELADQIAATKATAELLGRARIREKEAAALAKAGRKSFAEPVPFHEFADPLVPMTPAEALAYFRARFPAIVPAADTAAFVAAQEAAALAIAGVTEATILSSIQGVITTALAGGTMPRDAIADIDGLLDEAGLTTRNPVRAEAIFRTEMTNAYNGGAEEEGLAVGDTFPVWQYSNPNDGRSRPTHADKDGRYYANSPESSFSVVRGLDAADVIQCRCTPILVDRFTWKELQAAGASVETTW